MKHIAHGYTENTILGPYYCLYINEAGKIGSAVYGIRSAEACDIRAVEYHQSFDAPIKNPFLIQYEGK